MPKPQPHLEREKVVIMALQLLDEVGFEGLTLRKLADKLGVQAAALYWHFANKQDLIDQLAQKIIEDERAKRPPEAPPLTEWREILTVMAMIMRNSLTRYRDGALVIAHADLTRGTFQGRERMIEALSKAGFSEELAEQAIFTVSRYTLGCVFEEQADPRSRLGVDALADSVYSGFDPDFQFEQGLQAILNGLATRLP